MKEKIVLIGAGSVVFTRGLVVDIIRAGWECELALVDIDSDALAVAEGLSCKINEAMKSPLKISAATDRKEMLKDATVVICTIAVGGRRAWEKDVIIPRKYGIYQPVGDSVMPGGTSRALRMIPPMVEIAKDVLDLAPEVLFFNYGNPMSPICRGVRKATGANLVGLCHGVFQTATFIANILGVSEDSLKYTAIGMNHLTWFTEVRVKGKDAMPRLKEIALEKLGHGVNRDNLVTSFDKDGTAEWDDTIRNLDNAYTWQLVDLFGAVPAVLDRHITEFFPHMFSREGSYYGKTLGIDTYNFERVIEDGDNKFREMREQAFSTDPLPEDYFDRISGEHEQVIEIIESIRMDTGNVYSANLPNWGQIPNMPADAIIECPAIADSSGLRPIAQPSMNCGLVGTLATKFQWVETVVDAALEGNREKFIQSLIIDGAVNSVEMAKHLADDLLAANKEYLPLFE